MLNAIPSPNTKPALSHLWNVMLLPQSAAFILVALDVAVVVVAVVVLGTASFPNLV